MRKRIYSVCLSTISCLFIVSCFEQAPQLLEFSKEEYIPADLTIPLSGKLDLTYEIDQASIQVKPCDMRLEFIPSDKGGDDVLGDYFDKTFTNGSEKLPGIIFFEKMDKVWRLGFSLKPKQAGKYHILYRAYASEDSQSIWAWWGQTRPDATLTITVTQ
jgi:hypothetical protein